MLGREPHHSLLKDIFDVPIRRPGIAVADLGRDTDGDATGLPARRKRGKIAEGSSQAGGGREEYKGDEGKATEVVDRFDFNFHLPVDVKHEIVLACEITGSEAGDGEMPPIIPERGEANPPADRIDPMRSAGSALREGSCRGDDGASYGQFERFMKCRVEFTGPLDEQGPGMVSPGRRILDIPVPFGPPGPSYALTGRESVAT